MIPVQPQPEPPDFPEKVRIPGNDFLKSVSHPDTEQFNRHAYWRRVSEDMRRAYGGVCSYSALWCSRDAATTDHFIPKSKFPERAYEWSNFRLAARSMNTEKRAFQDVADPFTLSPESFVMEFPSLMIRSGLELTPSQRDKIESTINRLKLNEKEKYIEARREWLCAYCEDEITFSFLQKMAPFIAYELRRQKLEKRIVYIMKLGCQA
ncbi:MAG: hypothetical protein DRI57_06290 [Deltaproteobacteria bacterium]|nr:MAG: hypothetical protein DRI57_06290 [Deltaproteobacteria bacterium]